MSMGGIARQVAHRLLFSAWTCALGLVACNKSESPSQNEVVAYTSVDQVFSEPVFRAFEKHSGLRVRALYDTEETKSTGVLNRLLAESNAPQADVLWSGDPVRPFLLTKRGLTMPYDVANRTAIPAAFQAADRMWTGFAARARVLLVNTDRVNNEQMPKSIRDLADARYKGQTAIANPLFGTTTMHVSALFAAWGEQRAKAFLEELKTNQVRIASSNGEVKRLVVSGEIAFGLTDTDDANEALKAGAPVAVVYPDQDELGTLVMPTTVVILKGGPHPEEAKRLVDFLLSQKSEHMLAEAAAHMPLRQDVQAPKNVRRVADIRAMNVDYSKVAEQMEQIQPWLKTWTGL